MHILLQCLLNCFCFCFFLFLYLFSIVVNYQLEVIRLNYSTNLIAKSPLDYDSASSCGVFVVDSNNNYNNNNSNNSSMNLSGDELPPPPSDSVLNEFSSQYKNGY